MYSILKDAFITAFIAALLALPLAGARTIDGSDGPIVEWHLVDVALASFFIFMGRIALSLKEKKQLRTLAPLALGCALLSNHLNLASHFLTTVLFFGSWIIALRTCYLLTYPLLKNFLDVHDKKTFVHKCITPFKDSTHNLKVASWFLLLLAVVIPFAPFTTRYTMDVAIMVLTYVMLAWGLNITVGYTGLLDLGYAGFYAIGAYCYALLAQYTHIGFWTALPLSGFVAAFAAFILGLPVLRLRGDYFAIVTLGFGEIVRLILINWTTLTGGPNGISGIARPTLFGLEFTHQAVDAQDSFNSFFHLNYSPMQRIFFLYYIILLFAVTVGWLSIKLRGLPLGRAWEAFREDEIACASLGINRWRLKIMAYSLGAIIAGLAGAFFAARQGFISPESFTFTESATMLAIVILGGIGHPLGILLATLFIIGLPELFRDLEQYRMLAFGMGMVLIMIWRPGGMMSKRQPTITLPPLIDKST